MYNLGDQFKLNSNAAKSDAEIVVRGNNYRITIMTERLIRLEYDETGTFFDGPTEFVFNRNFERCKYGLRQDQIYLEIVTRYFKLTYQKGKPFKGTKINPEVNLKVELVNTDKVWYYGHPEIRNFGSPGLLLTDEFGHSKLKKGLYSSDGFVSLDDSLSLAINEDGTFSERLNKEVDIYLFMYNEDFNECLKDYFRLTGYPAFIPRYALGVWWSRNIGYNDYSLNKLLDKFHDKEIPVSAVLLNTDWHIKNNDDFKNVKSGYTWNKTLFKSPTETVIETKKRGVHLGLTLNSTGIYPFEEYYDKALEHLEKDENGIIPFNVYDPKCVDVYLKIFMHNLENVGTDFYFLDTIDNKINEEERWALTHYQFYDLKRSNSLRPLLMSYNSSIASHRYPILYSGKTLVSWDTLKLIPIFNSSASNIGVSFFAHDIGGYHNGMEDSELYVRFVELGTFSPILKFGSEEGKYYKREPWRWDVSTYEITKDYLNLRHQLIPYLYTESYKYHKHGVPIITPIYYKHKEMYDDPIYKSEYYFGSEFFVSPILNKKDPVMNRVVHHFYMPDGLWYDFLTGKKYPGGKSYVAFFKDEEYPVFAKAGAIIPMGKNQNINDTSNPTDMEIQVFPGVSNSYELYEDDGVSYSYLNGDYLKTMIEYNYMPSNYTVIIRPVEGKRSVVPDKRNYKIRFRNTKKAAEVIVNIGSTKVESTCYTEGADFVVCIDNVDTSSQLTINCKGNDIEINAVGIINDDINLIISDLPIPTKLKENIDAIIFSDEIIKKKRIAIRKLKSKGLDNKFIALFLKLLEYVDAV